MTKEEAKILYGFIVSHEGGPYYSRRHILDKNAMEEFKRLLSLMMGAGSEEGWQDLDRIWPAGDRQLACRIDGKAVPASGRPTE